MVVLLSGPRPPPGSTPPQQTGGAGQPATNQSLHRPLQLHLQNNVTFTRGHRGTGDRKHIPEAANAVESVLRTELLEAIPKPLAEACMRHGYCTAELIVWYIMKQLILPPDINEVTMQKEILTPSKVPPATLDQASIQMARRTATSIELVHQTHIVAFVIEALNGITQYYGTIYNISSVTPTSHLTESTTCSQNS